MMPRARDAKCNYTLFAHSPGWVVVIQLKMEIQTTEKTKLEEQSK